MTQDVLDRALTLTEALQSLVESQPDEEALVFVDRREDERALTLRDLWDHAQSVQAVLQQRGIEPGQVVRAVFICARAPRLATVGI